MEKQETIQGTFDLPQKTVIFELGIYRQGFTRRVRTSDIDETADPDMIHVAKDLVARESLRGVQRVDNDFRHWLQRRALSCSMLRGGVYLIPLTLVEQVDREFAAYKECRDVEVALFVASYAKCRDEARERLGPLYCQSDYPEETELLDAFRVVGRFWSFDAPAALSGISEELWEREKARVEAEWRQAAVEVQEALRLAMADLVGHLAERLKDTPDGKRQRIHDSAIEKLNEFLDSFAARNVTGDTELEGLVAKAKKILGGRDADDLRKASDVRAYVRTGFESVKKDIESLVVSRRRKITFDDDEQ